MVERLLAKEKAVGSSPISRSLAGVAQWNRAVVFETKGRRFESFRRRHKALEEVVVSDTENIAAMMHFWHIGGMVYIGNIEVKERYRRLGIATHMLRELDKYICLEVHEHNDAAVRLYLSHGLRVLKRITGYYKDGDALYMEGQADSWRRHLS